MKCIKRSIHLTQVDARCGRHLIEVDTKLQFNRNRIYRIRKDLQDNRIIEFDLLPSSNHVNLFDFIMYILSDS